MRRDSWGLVHFASHQAILVILELSALLLLLFRQLALSLVGIMIVEGILRVEVLCEIVQSVACSLFGSPNGNFGSHVGRFSDRYKLDRSDVEVEWSESCRKREGRGERLQALSFEA